MRLGETWVVKTTFLAWQIHDDKLDATSSPVKGATIFTIIKGPSSIAPDPQMVFFSVDSYHHYRAFEKIVRACCEPYPAAQI